MSHPLSTPISRGSVERAVAVGNVDRPVVADPPQQAVPEDLEPAVAERPEGGMVVLALGDLAVVELARPARVGQAAERPLLDGIAQVSVAGEAGRHDELALARATGDRRLAGIALEPVGGGEHLGMVASPNGLQC